MGDRFQRPALVQKDHEELLPDALLEFGQGQVRLVLFADATDHGKSPLVDGPFRQADVDQPPEQGLAGSAPVHFGDEGGPREAFLRGLVYVRLAEGAVDERGFAMIRRIREQHEPDLTLADFKENVREQFFMILLDERRALATIPQLLAGHLNEGPELFAQIESVVTAAGKLGKEGQQRLKEIEKLFISPQKGAAKKTRAPKKRPLKA